jgi:hypothetical protein
MAIKDVHFNVCMWHGLANETLQSKCLNGVHNQTLARTCFQSRGVDMWSYFNQLFMLPFVQVGGKHESGPSLDFRVSNIRLSFCRPLKQV